MVRLRLEIFYMLWAGLVVLSSATFLTLSNAAAYQCVLVDEVKLCKCAKYSHACRPGTVSGLDVHNGHATISNGFDQHDSSDNLDMPKFTENMVWPSGLKEIKFNFETRCLTDKNGKNQCLTQKSTRLQRNPYYIPVYDPPDWKNLLPPYPGSSTPSTDPNTSASIIPSYGGLESTQVASDDIDESVPDGEQYVETSSQEDLVNITPSPSTRRRRNTRAK